MHTDKHSDKGRFISAKGVHKKHTEFDTVTALHIVDFIFSIMSPVIVYPQRIAVDYGFVQGIIVSVKKKNFG